MSSSEDASYEHRKDANEKKRRHVLLEPEHHICRQWCTLQQPSGVDRTAHYRDLRRLTESTLVGLSDLDRQYSHGCRCSEACDQHFPDHLQGGR